jgi:hypothetical protein
VKFHFTEFRGGHGGGGWTVARAEPVASDSGHWNPESGHGLAREAKDAVSPALLKIGP